MKWKTIAAISMIFLLAPSVAKAQNEADTEIRKVLATQQAAWNRGQIDSFMVGYWQNDSLLFIGKKGPKYGYNTTLENYKKSYPDTTAMGQLQFEFLQIKRLSFQYAYVVGKWKLQRSTTNLDGYFTLLFKKMKKKWVIVSDHSS